MENKKCKNCDEWGNYGRDQRNPTFIGKDGKKWNHCGSEEAMRKYFQCEDPYCGIDTSEDFSCPAWKKKKKK